MIRAVALRITRDEAQADDAAQEAFIAAWRGEAGFRGDCASTTWLGRVAANAALGQQRRDRRHRAALTASNEWQAPPGEYVLCVGEARRSFIDHAEMHAFVNELHRRLTLIEALLSPQQAKIVRFALLSDLSTDEIALAVGVDKKQIIEQLSRALSAIRRWADGAPELNGGGPPPASETKAAA